MRRTEKKYILLLLIIALILLCASFIMLLTYRNSDEKLEDSSRISQSGNITITETMIGEIPVAIYAVNDQQPKPILFLLHGLTSKKEDMHSLALSFAQENIMVISPDAYNHGQRALGDPLSVLEMAVQSSYDIDTIIDSLSENPDANTERISILGFSMGGFTSYYYWAYGQHRLEMVIPFAASPDWPEMIGNPNIYQYTKKGRPHEVSDEDIARIDDFAREHNPFTSLANKNSAHVLIVCQPNDPIVPTTGMEKLYDILKSNTPDIVDMLIDETGAHNATEKSVQRINIFVHDTFSNTD